MSLEVTRTNKLACIKNTQKLTRGTAIIKSNKLNGLYVWQKTSDSRACVVFVFEMEINKKR
jgi:hypothetical protein